MNQNFTANTKTAAHSTYSGCNFNSYFTYRGVCYGADSDGIHKLDGDDDNGVKIQTTLGWGALSLGSMLAKGLNSLYILARQKGAIEVEAVADETRSRRYVSDERAGDRDNLVTRRVHVARGIFATTWRIVLRNVKGSRIAVQSVAPEIAQKTRHR